MKGRPSSFRVPACLPAMGSRDPAVRSLVAGVAVSVLCAGVGSGVRAAGPTPTLSGPEAGTGYGAGYAFGQQLGRLERQGAGLDLEAVLRGVLDGLANAEPREQGVSAAGKPAEPTPVLPAPPARTRGYMDDFAALNARRPGVTTLPSGVQYEILAAGDGGSPEPGDWVTIGYEGRLTTGAVFDTTHDDAEALRTRVADIAVPGLREAILLMKPGAKWRVVIPPRMGFGTIGNNMLRKRDLVYEVELVSVEPPDQPPARAQKRSDTGKPD